MNTRKQQIIERFKQVKERHFVKSNRKNNTGVGKTFEDYVGVVENNFDEPDLFGYEIKSHREEASSYITLFTKSPDFPTKANAYLKESFGEQYEDNPQLKRLHTSMFATRFNTYSGKYSFRLINDIKKQALYIGVYTLEDKTLIDSSVGYTYASIDKVINTKLKDLFYVNAERKFENGDEYFFFHSAEIYAKPSLNKFLFLLDNGFIMYDIRIGSYKTGKNFGKPHDHGSGFRILGHNLRLLYEQYEKIE